MKMKAAVLYETGQPLVIENDIEIPSLKEGQVLVKLAYSGVCHSQLMEVRGKRGKDHYLPHLLGHEGSGHVVEIGKNVTKVHKGDAVILGWIKGEGIDAFGTQYRKNDTIINSGGVTTFNEYSIVSENRCVKLPDRIPLDIAVLFGCAVPTGIGMVINMLHPQPADSIAIFGLGGIGLSALIAAKLSNCSPIIAVDVEENKLQNAKELGATHVINSHQQDSLEMIYQLTNNQGVDYSIEAAGLTSTIEQAFESVRMNGGLCVFASHPTNGEKIQLDPHHLICGKQIQGTWGGKCDPDRDIPLFADLYRNSKIPLEKLLSNSYPLECINNALDDLENRIITRALIEIDPCV